MTSILKHGEDCDAVKQNVSAAVRMMHSFWSHEKCDQMSLGSKN